MRQLVPDVIILELGSNNLVELSPQTVGSELESLVRELYEIDSVQFVAVGQVLRRHTPNSVEYNCKVGKLHQYLKVVLEPLPFCYYWRHRGNLFCCVLKRHFLSSKKKNTQKKTGNCFYMVAKGLLSFVQRDASVEADKSSKGLDLTETRNRA